MKRNNLWITTLALGIALSAYGQQADGGISSEDAATDQTILQRNTD